MNICPVLVGRDAELEQLARALDSGGGLVLIEGEAGIGKTRLLREFASTARRPVVWGRPEAVARPGPYSLIVDLLDDLASALGSSGDEARAMADSLGALAEGAEPPARQIAARIRGLLGQLGSARIVMIEDLHASDELSQAVIAHLARSAHDDGTLLVATYRSEEAQTGGLARLLDLLTRDRIATRIELEPLTAAALAQMLEVMWGAPATTEDLHAIERLGEGIPFFIEELAAARDVTGRGVPPTISRAVLTRMQRLSEEGRAVMCAASLMRGALDPGVLAEVCGLAEHAIPSILVDAVRAGLLSDQEGRLAFRHALVRESIAEGIVSVARAELHGVLAEVIQRRYAGDLESQSSSLAEHYREAGDLARAAEFSVMAGKRALAVGALEEARAAFEFARDAGLEGAVTLNAVTGIAEVLVRTHSLDEAAGFLLRAVNGHLAAGEYSEAGRVLTRLSWARFMGGDRLGALEAIDRACEILAERDGDPVRVQAVIDKGYLLVRGFERPTQAEPLLRDGEVRATRLGDLELRAKAHEGLAWVAEASGNHTASDHHGAEACRFAVESGAGALMGRVLSAQALRLEMRGRCRDALDSLDDVRDRLQGGIDTFYLHALENLRVWVLWRMGSPSEAERAASRLQATRYARQHAGIVRIWASMHSGDPARTEAMVSAWWAELGDADHRRQAIARPGDVPGAAPSEVYVILAELLVRVLGPSPIDQETLVMANAYQELCRDADADTRLLVTLLRARALMRAGDLDSSSCALDETEDLLKTWHYRSHEATMHEIRGAILMSRGSPAEAVVLLDRAIHIHSVSGNQADQARCTCAAAEAMVAAGEDREPAIARLKTAREVADAAGSVVEVNHAESVMRSLGVRPRAGRPKGPRRETGTLSTREQEVVALVAAGSTNAEIGRRLFLSERTIQDHIASAQRRLAVTGRAGLAAWAAKQGLV